MHSGCSKAWVKVSSALVFVWHLCLQHAVASHLLQHAAGLLLALWMWNNCQSAMLQASWAGPASACKGHLLDIISK